jgi:hypothetical protein
MVHPYKVKQSQLEMILIHMDAELPLLKLELGLYQLVRVIMT